MGEFNKFFMYIFLPDSQNHKYTDQFEKLIKTSDMDVSTYNTKFSNLSRYALYLVSIEATRVQMFC